MDGIIDVVRQESGGVKNWFTVSLTAGMGYKKQTAASNTTLVWRN
jgi:hypothetical protein